MQNKKSRINPSIPIRTLVLFKSVKMSRKSSTKTSWCKRISLLKEKTTTTVKILRLTSKLKLFTRTKTIWSRAGVQLEQLTDRLVNNMLPLWSIENLNSRDKSHRRSRLIDTRPSLTLTTRSHCLKVMHRSQKKNAFKHLQPSLPNKYLSIFKNNSSIRNFLPLCQWRWRKDRSIGMLQVSETNSN